MKLIALISTFALALLLLAGCVGPGSDCSSSYCGCTRVEDVTYSTTVDDENGNPLEGIEVYCRGEETPWATTDALGQVALTITSECSPGCGCQETPCEYWRFVDPEGNLEPIELIYREVDNQTVTMRPLGETDDADAGTDDDADTGTDDDADAG